VLDRYRKWLYYYRKPNGQPLSFRSQYTRLIPIRAFFKWLARNNYILYNPASELELPRLEQRLPRAVLTVAEAETILNLPDTREAMGLRDRAILEVFYSTGIRRMEVPSRGVPLPSPWFDISFLIGTVDEKGACFSYAPRGETRTASIASRSK
jgi:site-specific recombinase XerD